MKTAEEILTEVHRELNATYIEANIMSDTPVGDRKQVALEAMKRYALEVAKEALRNASKHVDVDDFEYLHRYGKCFKNVLSEDNIPQEVKP